MQIGKGRILVEGSRVAILGYGSVVQQCRQASEMLKELGIDVTVADARFCKPLDTGLIRLLAKEHEILITVEEGSIGGFGSHVSQFLSLSGILDGPLKVYLPLWRSHSEISFSDYCSLQMSLFCVLLSKTCQRILDILAKDTLVIPSLIYLLFCALYLCLQH